MRTETGHTFRLEDYRPTPYAIPETKLDFILEPEKTIVKAQLTIERRAETPPGTPLVLDGDELKLIGLSLNGTPLGDNGYSATPDQLEITDLPDADRFTLEIITEVNPTTNRQLGAISVE